METRVTFTPFPLDFLSFFNLMRRFVSSAVGKKKECRENFKLDIVASRSNFGTTLQTRRVVFA